MPAMPEFYTDNERAGWDLAERELADATPAIRHATFAAWERQSLNETGDLSKGSPLREALNGAMGWVIALEAEQAD